MNVKELQQLHSVRDITLGLLFAALTVYLKESIPKNFSYIEYHYFYFFYEFILLILLLLYVKKRNLQLAEERLFKKIHYVIPGYALYILLGASFALCLLFIFPSAEGLVDQRRLLDRICHTDNYFLSIAIMKGIILTVFAPIYEELLFRLLIEKTLSKYTRQLFATAVASLIFALLHMNANLGTYNFFILSSMFIFSSISSLLYYKTRSIAPSILFHALHNSFVLLSFFFEE